MVKEQNKYEDIGKKIKEARESRGLSQRELAESLGYESATAISYIESGERKVSVVDLESISKTLHQDIRFFIGQKMETLDIRVALIAEPELDKKDKDTILHIIDMAKRRIK